MRTRGINYDTGFRPGGELSRERFDPAVVRAEMLAFRALADACARFPGQCAAGP